MDRFGRSLRIGTYNLIREPYLIVTLVKMVGIGGRFGILNDSRKCSRASAVLLTLFHCSNTYWWKGFYNSKLQNQVIDINWLFWHKEIMSSWCYLVKHKCFMCKIKCMYDCVFLVSYLYLYHQIKSSMFEYTFEMN